MTLFTHRLIKWGAFIVELVTLPMLYSAVLLDPFPYDWARFSAVGSTATVSIALAYLSSSQFKHFPDTNRLRLKQIITKPPFVVWLTIVGFIAVRLLAFWLLD